MGSMYAAIFFLGVQNALLGSKDLGIKYLESLLYCVGKPRSKHV